MIEIKDETERITEIVGIDEATDDAGTVAIATSAVTNDVKKKIAWLLIRTSL